MPFTDSQYTQRTKREPHLWGGYEETQERFEINHWGCYQDVNIENVEYKLYRRTEFLETGTWPQGVVTRIDYTGWRLNGKYFASHPRPCFEFVFHLRNEAQDKIKKLQKILSKDALPSLLGTRIVCSDKDTIVSSDKDTTYLTASFLEQSDSTDLNKFFNSLIELDPDLKKVIQDIKETISYDCFRWFLWKLEGRSRKNWDMSQFEEACTKLHHNNFEGVPSPFYMAAIYLKNMREHTNATWLLGNILPNHWQYEQAQKLRQEMADLEKKKDNEIADLMKQLEDMRLMLAQASRQPISPASENVNANANGEDTIPPLVFSTVVALKPVATEVSANAANEVSIVSADKDKGSRHTGV